MGEGFIIRKGGGAAAERTAAPSINFISATTTSLTFTFTNNDEVEVDLYYGIENPPTTKITLDANTTSSNQTISNLNNTNTFSVFAYSVAEPTSKKIKSEIVETEAKTKVPSPTISNTVVEARKIIFTLTNNSSQNGELFFGVTNFEFSSQINANSSVSNLEIDNLEPLTNFTLSAKTLVEGFDDSDVVNFNFTTSNPFTAATGGTIDEYDLDGKRYRSHTFTGNGNFVVTSVGETNDERNKVDFLIVGGGAGGAQRTQFALGGGGGAGGYRTSLGTSGGSSDPLSKFTVTQTSYPVTRGGGGGVNNNGGNSSAFGIIANGGGRGGRVNEINPNVGGSGGGGGSGQPGANGLEGQGSRGGNGGSGNFHRGGRGGGASGTPTTHNANGLENIIRTGEPVFYAGGGGAGGFNQSVSSPGNGAIGRGGNGGRANGEAATSGSAGIVIIRYEIAPV